MIYLLNKATICALGSCLKKDDTLVYKEEVPSYIKEFFEKEGIKVEECNTNNFTTLFPFYEPENWFTEEEFKNMNFWVKKYIITSQNFEDVISKIKPEDEIYYSEAFDENTVNYLNSLQNKVVHTPITERFPYDVIFYHTNRVSSNKNEITDNSTVLHYLGANQDGTKIYRRFKLNDYLKQKYEIDTIYRILSVLTKTYKTYIISDGRCPPYLLQKAVKDNAKIFYDRTDNWGALSDEIKEQENELIKKATHIFCSSQYLYDTLPEEYKEKAEIVLNGCDVKDYMPLEKFKTKTAIYIGGSNQKIDFDLIEKLLKENPDWDFKFYGVRLIPENIKEYKNFKEYAALTENGLHIILEKCHIGLIPFVNTDWTKGMLPLKTFHYINAHLPIGYTNCKNLENYKGIIFDLNNFSLNRILELKIDNNLFDKYIKEVDWKDKFSYIENKIFGEK